MGQAKRRKQALGDLYGTPKGFASKEKQPLCFKMKTQIAGRYIPDAPPGIFLLEVSNDCGSAVVTIEIGPGTGVSLDTLMCYRARILATRGKFNVRNQEILNGALVFLWTTDEAQRIDFSSPEGYDFSIQTDKTRVGQWVPYVGPPGTNCWVNLQLEMEELIKRKQGGK